MLKTVTIIGYYTLFKREMFYVSEISRLLQAISKLTTSEKSRAAIAQVMRYNYISSEETDSDVENNEAAPTQLQRRPGRVRRLQHESPRLRAIKKPLDTIYFDEMSTPVGKKNREPVWPGQRPVTAREVCQHVQSGHTSHDVMDS